LLNKIKIRSGVLAELANASIVHPRNLVSNMDKPNNFENQKYKFTICVIHFQFTFEVVRKLAALRRD
jgi:hypothetical protein